MSESIDVWYGMKLHTHFTHSLSMLLFPPPPLHTTHSPKYKNITSPPLTQT